MEKCLSYATRSDDPNGVIDVRYRNGTILGHIFLGGDGYYVFHPKLRNLCWEGDALKELGEHLIEMNTPWSREVANHLDKSNELDFTAPIIVED